jgi:bifunctional DNA-binding transcriptional regulator/antitoxin component of YhaV-PrlF toxin-antitoxin module
MFAQKTYIDSSGRIALSAKMRKILNLKVGDEVTIKCKNNELVITTFQANLSKARSILSKYNKLDLANELKKLREEDANQDS